MKLTSLFSERPISYYPILKRITGSITSAIFLQQMFYWWDKKDGEEIYKKVSEFEKETGLTKKEQLTAIKKLSELGFISVINKSLRKTGGSPVRHFTLHTEIIDQIIESRMSPKGTLECPQRGHSNVPKGDTPTYTENTSENTSIARATPDAVDIQEKSESTTTALKGKTERQPSMKRLPEEPMDLRQFVDWCMKSKSRHVQIIGTWASSRTIDDYRTYGQWQVFFRRNLRAAEQVARFDDDQIHRAYARMSKEESSLKYTPKLESLLNHLTKK